MKRLSLVLLYFVAVAGFACLQAKDKSMEIPFEQLPAKAQTLLNTSFNGLEVKKITQKDVDGIPEYTVKLKDNTEIEFDMVGAWNYIKATKSDIPNSVYPKKLMKEFEKNFVGKRTKYVENDGMYYSISFKDGTFAKANAIGDILEFPEK